MLLEVLWALVILSIAVLGFYQGQSGVVQVSVRSEHLAQAVELAQAQMSELEILAKKKNFEALPDEEKGEFKDEKLNSYRWIRKLEKIELGCFIPTPKGDEQRDASQDGQLAFAQKVFEQNIRKAVVTVEWLEGQKTRSTSLAQLLVRFEDLPSF